MAKAAKTRLKEPIAECEARVRSAAERLSKTLSFVPDDKLNWSPAKTARTSLAIVAHCCLANRMFAKVIRGEPISPMPTPEEVGVSSRKFEATIHDRAEAVRLLEDHLPGNRRRARDDDRGALRQFPEQPLRRVADGRLGAPAGQAHGRPRDPD